MPKREEITDEKRQLGNEKICNLCSPSVIRAIKMRIRWVGHAVSMAGREMLNPYPTNVENRVSSE